MPGRAPMTDPPVTPPATRRGPVLAGLVLAMFMAAIEGTIVATAMPSIAAQLGGFSLYGWVFSSYLLMQAVTTPMSGKLADLYGRKPVFVAGVTVFLIGSILCGFAPSMPALIAFRLLQGLGAGAVQPVTITLAGDLYAFHERARVQGWLSSVWGLSAVVGPLAGGLIVTHFEWAWIFWLNVPFGILAVATVAAFLHEDVESRQRSIDGVGAGLFFVGVASLMVLLTQAATLPWAWRASLLALSGGALLAFALQERRAPEALMPPSLWRDRLVATANVATLGAGMVMIAVIAYLPTYVQGVIGRGALVAGFTLTTMSIGWPIASVGAGVLMVRWGVRSTARIGGSALLLGSVLFGLLTPERGAAWAASASFFVGVGMGMLSTTFLVSIQSKVDWRRRGVATATNMLMRILGNALGAAAFGGIVNAALERAVAAGDAAGSVSLDAVTRLLGDPGALEPETLTRMSGALEAGIGAAFWAMAALAALTCLLAYRLPALEPVGESEARVASR